MQNIKAEVRGSQLILTIDLNKPLGLSSSKKSILLASAGKMPVEGHPGVFAGINVYKDKK